jgi:hypothetical protein
MASALGGSVSKEDWPLSNPWAWMASGLTATLVAFGAKFFSAVTPVHLLLIGAGMILTGVALWIRLGTSGPAYLARLPRPRAALVLLALFVLYLLLALGITGALLLRLLGVEALAMKPGQLIILWFLVVPMSVQAVQNVWLHLRSGEPPTDREEASTLLFLSGLASFFACQSLYNPDRPTDWDTIRLLFAVMAFVAVVAAPLMVLSSAARRAVVSAMLVVHFGGICTAILAVPPSPWLANQIWVRIYRPYLEFMYLNNAYHFYAPEPGPSHFLWFRLTYVDDKGADHGHWVKVPEFNDRTGRHPYAVALNYQRFLALTENTVATEAMPAISLDGINLADYIRRRVLHTEDGAKEWEKRSKDPVVGKDIGPRPGPLLIPFHRYVPQTQQYQAPAAHVRRLLESFAAHVGEAGRYPHPEHPEYRLKSIKIYRVIHAIAPPAAFMNGMNANDPEFYRPFFLGEFEPDGKLKQEQDPFLYWLLPVLRDNTQDLNSPIRDWARRHAGDRRWIWRWDLQAWVEGE